MTTKQGQGRPPTPGGAKGKKKTAHPQYRKKENTAVKAARATRKQTRATEDDQAEAKAIKPGPGRPKGSTIQPSGLTPNQERIAHDILDVELKDGIFPASVAQLGRATATDPKVIRALLRREDFQKYMADLLKTEGVVLEGAFWRGMALGLQVGDPKVLDLYARMSGKIKQEKAQAKLTIEIKSPDGQAALPMYTLDEEGDIVDAELVGEEDAS